MRADRRIHMEILGVKGSTDINTKLIIYYKCILGEFKDIRASGCRSREFLLNVMSKKITSKRKVERSAREREAPSRTTLCLVPNTRCHIILKTWKISCGPRISLSWMCTFQPFYVRLAAGKQQADVLKANAYGGMGFCKEEAKTFGQLLLHTGKKWIMADRK